MSDTAQSLLIVFSPVLLALLLAFMASLFIAYETFRDKRKK